MNEHELEKTATRLGTDAAARLDVERVAAKVVTELRTRPTVRWWRGTIALRAAAAVAVLLIGGTVATSIIDEPATPIELAGPVGIGDLTTVELTEVLDSLDGFTPVYELLPVTLEDLNETELQELLAAMEG